MRSREIQDKSCCLLTNIHNFVIFKGRNLLVLLQNILEIEICYRAGGEKNKIRFDDPFVVDIS